MKFHLPNLKEIFSTLGFPPQIEIADMKTLKAQGIGKKLIVYNPNAGKSGRSFNGSIHEIHDSVVTIKLENEPSNFINIHESLFKMGWRCFVQRR